MIPNEQKQEHSHRSLNWQSHRHLCGPTTTRSTLMWVRKYHDKTKSNNEWAI